MNKNTSALYVSGKKTNKFIPVLSNSPLLRQHQYEDVVITVITERRHFCRASCNQGKGSRHLVALLGHQLVYSDINVTFVASWTL